MTVILGDGGHARELQSIYFAKMLGKGDPVPDDESIIIGVGDMAARRRLYREFKGYRFPAVIAWPQNHSALSADLPAGLQVMRNVTLCNNVKFGVNVLVNTGAQIDHDCIIGNHSIIAPGAILCGNVTLGEACFVGAGAIIIQGVTLEPETFVPAGTLVVGPGDFRKPQRMVRTERALEGTILEEEYAWPIIESRQRPHPDT